ncbi:ATP-binding cassette domain-containing protein, partial [Flavobacterium sp.]
PTTGSFSINDDTYRKVDINQFRLHIGTILHDETPFEGTILENITFKNAHVSDEQVKWAIDSVGLGSFIKSLPEGLDTMIYPEGRQLSSSNAQKILLARSIVTQPKILFYEDPLDKMDDDAALKIIDFLTDSKHPWTLIVTSKNPYWKQKCNRIIQITEGKISNDITQ